MKLSGGATALALFFALSSGAAHGQGRRFEGFGRLTAGVGWRLTPNDHFYAAAREQGLEPVAPSPGGPAVCLCFGYSATDAIEIGIDLGVSAENLTLVGSAPIHSVTYGALVGVRWQLTNLIGDWVVPYLGAFTGPMLVNVSSAEFGSGETLVGAWAGAAGVSLWLTERMGLTVDYKVMLARGSVPSIGSVNGGGQSLTVGLTFYFPPEPTPGSTSF